MWSRICKGKCKHDSYGRRTRWCSRHWYIGGHVRYLVILFILMILFVLIQYVLVNYFSVMSGRFPVFFWVEPVLSNG